jgi:hypothetical protein
MLRRQACIAKKTGGGAQMRNIKRLEVGARVRVIPQHWLRGGDAGEVIRFEQRGKNNWLIQFDIRYLGGGIDGDKLWLDENELSELTDNDVRAYRPHRGDDTDKSSVPVDIR